MADSSPPKLDLFVARMGEYFAQAGQPRIAGQLLGWLLVCDPPQQSAGDLAEATGASKGSISNMIRLLLATACVDRVGMPGERKTYYQIRPGVWSDLLEAQTAKVTVLREIADEGLAALEDTSPQRRERLQGMRDLHAFFEQEMPAMIERWQEQNRK